MSEKKIMYKYQANNVLEEFWDENSKINWNINKKCFKLEN